MKIDKKNVNKLSKLARLSFNDDEAKTMLVDFQQMLKFVDKLAEVNTDNVTPLTHVHNDSNIYRSDKIYNLNIKEEVLKNAPNYNSDYIKVPKVIS